MSRKNKSRFEVEGLDVLMQDVEIVMSFDECFENWMDYNTMRALSQDTLSSYRKEIKSLRNHLIDNDVNISNIKNIKEKHIKKWIKEMMSKNFANKTINARIRTAKLLFNYCVKNKLIPLKTSPLEEVPILQDSIDVGRTFTKSEVNRLRKAINLHSFEGVRDYAIITTFYHTGARLGELHALNVENIDFNEANNGVLHLYDTKTKEYRRIPLTEELSRVLTVYLKNREKTNPKTKSLFVSTVGKQITKRTIQERIQIYGKLAGVPNASPHAFRRTFCKQKVEAGVSVFTIQAMSGHKELDMLKRYVKIYSKDVVDNIEKGL